LNGVKGKTAGPATAASLFAGPKPVVDPTIGPASASEGLYDTRAGARDFFFMEKIGVAEVQTVAEQGGAGFYFLERMGVAFD
jgi:hypothetical protein